jgi:hypothetical protein
MEIPKDPKEILQTHPYVQEILKLTGVKRIEIEYYGTFGSTIMLPIFVVHCSNEFKDRDKIPAEIEKIRLIVDYTTEIVGEEAEEIRKIMEDDDDDGEEGGDEGGEEGQDDDDGEENILDFIKSKESTNSKMEQ